MPSKLSKVHRVNARPNPLPAILIRFSLAILLNFVLLAWTPSAKAQSAATEKGDGSISGIVYALGNNHTADQVAVSLKSHEAGIFRSVLTDYDGRFEVKGLPPSTYEINIEEQGYEPYRSTVRLEGPSINVELHLRATPLQQDLREGYTVSVRELTIPGKAKEEYRKGLEGLAKKAFTESLKHFMKAVGAFPNYYEAFYHQGVVQASLGQMEKAMQAFQTAINLSGGRYANAQFGVGYMLYLQGKPAEAERIVRRGLEIDQNSADGYVILGMALLRLDRTDEAEKNAREALLRNPNKADAYLVLADTYARRQNYREQILDLDTYLKLDPTGPASQRAQQIREVAARLLAGSQP
jgi:tetratricopeptide (TPR) repeat protein